jgi:hypothetical protein
MSVQASATWCWRQPTSALLLQIADRRTPASVRASRSGQLSGQDSGLKGIDQPVQRAAYAASLDATVARDGCPWVGAVNNREPPTQHNLLL